MLFDSHIHLDQFSDSEIATLCANRNLHGFLAVATDLASSQRLLALKQRFTKIYCAAGFHPEQKLATAAEFSALFDWIAKNHTHLTALGEVGLPYYRKQADPSLDYQPYLDLLEQFMLLSKRYDLPLNLHVVYHDSETVLALLRRHRLSRAHFHWFKADETCLAALIHSPYYVSLTPDILSNPKTQKVAEKYPLDRLLIETDAPWRHSGFAPIEVEGQLNAVISQLARLKEITKAEVCQQIEQNVRKFYLI